jgi:hypothetical protein
MIWTCGVVWLFRFFGCVSEVLFCQLLLLLLFYTTTTTAGCSYSLLLLLLFPILLLLLLPAPTIVVVGCCLLLLYYLLLTNTTLPTIMVFGLFSNLVACAMMNFFKLIKRSAETMVFAMMWNFYAEAAAMMMKCAFVMYLLYELSVCVTWWIAWNNQWQGRHMNSCNLCVYSLNAYFLLYYLCLNMRKFDFEFKKHFFNYEKF